MARYIAKRKTWLAHECRIVEEGEEFETTFPAIDGKPMRLSDNIELVKPAKKAAASESTDTIKETPINEHDPARL